MDEKNKVLFSRLTIGALSLVGFGTVFYHYQEGFSWVDSLYFTMITLTTVGYGDLSPQTELGKLFTVGFIVIGISILGAFLNALTKNRIEKQADRKMKKIDSKKEK